MRLYIAVGAPKEELGTGGAQQFQSLTIMTFGGVITKGPNPNVDMDGSYCDSFAAT